MRGLLALPLSTLPASSHDLVSSEVRQRGFELDIQDVGEQWWRLDRRRKEHASSASADFDNHT